MVNKQSMKLLKNAGVKFELLNQQQQEFINDIEKAVLEMNSEKKELEDKLSLVTINKKNICNHLNIRRSKLYEEKYSSALKFTEELIKCNTNYEEKYTVKEFKKHEFATLTTLSASKDILIKQYENEIEQLKREISRLKKINLEN